MITLYCYLLKCKNMRKENNRISLVRFITMSKSNYMPCPMCNIEYNVSQRKQNQCHHINFCRQPLHFKWSSPCQVAIRYNLITSFKAIFSLQQHYSRKFNHSSHNKGERYQEIHSKAIYVIAIRIVALH